MDTPPILTVKVSRALITSPQKMLENLIVNGQYPVPHHQLELGQCTISHAGEFGAKYTRKNDEGGLDVPQACEFIKVTPLADAVAQNWVQFRAPLPYKRPHEVNSI